eukprot:RCo013667
MVIWRRDPPVAMGSHVKAPQGINSVLQASRQVPSYVATTKHRARERPRHLSFSSARQSAESSSSLPAASSDHPARRGPISLQPANKTDYDQFGFNVKLSPIPAGWSHEHLRTLLSRVNAPEPVSWNLQPHKSVAWTDYEFPKQKREAIARLDSLMLPGGVILSATP